MSTRTRTDRLSRTGHVLAAITVAAAPATLWIHSGWLLVVVCVAAAAAIACWAVAYFARTESTIQRIFDEEIDGPRGGERS